MSAENSVHNLYIFFQGRSHGYYNQYQPNFNESSSWTLWRSPPPPAAYAKGRRRRWGGVLLGAAAFSVVLAVVVITGLAIYMGGEIYNISTLHSNHNLNSPPPSPTNHNP